MTRERAKELLPIIQAYAEGKEIEYRKLIRRCENWYEITKPTWNDTTEYRIKPEPKYVPFTRNDDLLGERIENKFTHAVFMISGVTNEHIYVGPSFITYGELFNDYIFVDGSPCGKVVSE